MSQAEPHPLAPGPPAVHLAPPVGWMNDPNGLIFHDGVFHAFYQHYPYDNTWGPMHWRHASSTDLMRWEDHGIALAPDHNGWVFSGSAVLDRGDTSGLARGVGFPLVAVFTHNLPPANDQATASQSQSLAYSLDHGVTWEVYDENPVLPSNRRDFRDPKVTRYPDEDHDDQTWVMVLAAGDHLEFHRSPNLIDWTVAGEYRVPARFELGLLECPDLVKVAGDRWLLLFSASADAHLPRPFGLNGTYAVRGRFDGWDFVATDDVQPLDSGPDFYATQSFSEFQGPEGETLVMAWMNNWTYARHHPSAGTRGLLTAPRLLSTDGDGRVLQRLPWSHPAPRSVIDGSLTIPARPGQAFDLVLEEQFTLRIVDSETHPALTVTADGEEIAVERRVPDLPAASQTYRMDLRRSSPLSPTRILVDHGSIEIFADDGRSVLTALVFAGPDWWLNVSGQGTMATVPA